LLRGSHPRIEVDSQRRKNTSIALEEVKRGLVPFTINDEDKGEDGNNIQPIIGESA
jgi:DNA-directed RNA polymerase subunit K/omega